MKRPFLIVCAALVIGAGFTAWAENDAPDKGPNPEVARKMGYRTLANGAVIYEEVQPEGDNTAGADNPVLENIAPAAGGDDAQDTTPQFKYDPLTQTYRRITVDRNGNTGQDVINTNR